MSCVIILSPVTCLRLPPVLFNNTKIKCERSYYVLKHFPPRSCITPLAGGNVMKGEWRRFLSGKGMKSELLELLNYSSECESEWTEK